MRLAICAEMCMSVRHAERARLTSTAHAHRNGAEWLCIALKAQVAQPLLHILPRPVLRICLLVCPTTYTSTVYTQYLRSSRQPQQDGHHPAA